MVYHSQAISKLLGNTTATYTIRVWTGGEGYPFYPGNLIAQIVGPAYTKTEQQWYRVKLDNPVTIPNNQELWIGYHVNTPFSYPASCDNGHQVEGFGNLVKKDNEWLTLRDWGGQKKLIYNWMINGIAKIQTEVQ